MKPSSECGVGGSSAVVTSERVRVLVRVPSWSCVESDGRRCSRRASCVWGDVGLGVWCVAGVLLEGEGDCERCRSCTLQSRGSVDGSVNVSARRVGAKASLRSFRVAARASIMVLACWIAVYVGIKQTKE
jgi:hypothetical protein